MRKLSVSVGLSIDRCRCLKRATGQSPPIAEIPLLAHDLRSVLWQLSTENYQLTDTGTGTDNFR
jgi:hypothetical protein